MVVRESGDRVADEAAPGKKEGSKEIQSFGRSNPGSCYPGCQANHVSISGHQNPGPEQHFFVGHAQWAYGWAFRTCRAGSFCTQGSAIPTIRAIGAEGFRVHYT